MKSYLMRKRAPRNPSALYLQNLAWLRAFRDCGFFGDRAVAHADAATFHSPRQPFPTQR
jgi:hypothetical protein